MIQQYGSALFVGNRLQETNMDTDKELTKKNVALKPYIYEMLVELKRGRDTFSDVIERLIQGKKK